RREAGGLASGMIVEALSALPRPDNFSLFVDAVEQALQDVNSRIGAHADQAFEGRMMGSTVVALLLADGYGACVWAGDSRLYRWRRRRRRNHPPARSEEHTSELQSRENLVCRLLLEKKKQVQTAAAPTRADV